MKRSIAFCRRQIDRWVRQGRFDEATAQRLDDDLPKLEAAAEPYLFPWLYPVLDEWSFFGNPIVVASGELTTFVFSRAADLYAARLLRLRDSGLSESALEFMLHCFRAADQELLDITREEVAEAMKRASEKAKARR